MLFSRVISFVVVVVALNNVLAVTAGKAGASFLAPRQGSKQPPATPACRRTQYSVPEVHYEQQVKQVPYDCSETQTQRQCQQVSKTIQKQCPVQSMKTEVYSCPEMKEEVVCDQKTAPRYHSKKRRLGKASFHRPGPSYSHGKKHAAPQQTCRKITKKINKQCNRTVPITTMTSCPQVVQQEVCKQVPVTIRKTCTRQETETVPVTRNKSMFREECTTVRVGKDHQSHY